MHFYYLKKRKMNWRTRFAKVKHSLGNAYNASMKVLPVTDRAHALLSKGYNAVGDQLEPEVRQRVGWGFAGLFKTTPAVCQRGR